jgi:hypothetical protein
MWTVVVYLSPSWIILVHDRFLQHRISYLLITLIIPNFIVSVTDSVDNRTINSNYQSRDSSAGRAMGYELEGPGMIPGSARFFSSPKRPDLF